MRHRFIDRVDRRYLQLAAPRDSIGVIPLPGEDEADVAGHAAGILEHLGLEVKAQWPQVIVPEFVSSFGPSLQRRFPPGLRVVDPSAAIGAQHVGKAVDLNLTLS